MSNKHFPNAFFLVGIFIPICFIFFSIFSQESNASEKKKVYEDGRIGVILEKIERTVEYPAEWRVAGNLYFPPKKGHDYVVVYFTIEIIKNIHIVSFGGRGDEVSILHSANGEEYKLATWNSKGWKYQDPSNIRSPSELVRGAEGIMLFVFPKQEQFTQLSFLYYFKETWEDKHKRAGKINIMIAPN